MDSDSSPNTTTASGTKIQDLENTLTAETMTVEIKPLSRPEPSDWQVYLFGKPGDLLHMVYNPIKGSEPNWFHRKMQEWILGFKWRKK